MDLLAKIRTLPKTWTVVTLFCIGVAVTYLLPGLVRFQPVKAGELKHAFVAPWQTNPLTQIFRKNPSDRPVDSITAYSNKGGTDDKAKPSKPRPKNLKTRARSSRSIDDPTGSMVYFYAALQHTARQEKGAVTRICHFGDSPITGDLISGDAREKLQGLYGDAGNGYILPGRPWEWYNHRGTDLEASGWRLNSPWQQPLRNGSYGLGGTVFTSGAPRAFSRVATAHRGPGMAVGLISIFYRAKPGGGTILAVLDKSAPVEILTKSGIVKVEVRCLKAPDGSHTLTLRPKGDGEVTLYGVALERETAGVVYDALGSNGASIHHLTLFDADDWEASLRLRQPHLVIFNYGTNESGYDVFSYSRYIEDFKNVIRRTRQAVPGVSILIMAPMDRGMHDETGEIVTMPSIPKLVEAQRRVAHEEGCAFFNTFAAMGGVNTMARWYDAEPRLVSGDLTHPTATGAAIVGRLLVEALQEGFKQFQSAQTETDLPAPPLPSKTR